jgi:hypothetical protein
VDIEGDSRLLFSFNLRDMAQAHSHLQRCNMTARASAISELHPQPSADETTLAELGYKQEFHREFTPLEVSLFSGSSMYATQANNCTGGWTCIQLCRSSSFYGVSHHYDTSRLRSHN